MVNHNDTLAGKPLGINGREQIGKTRGDASFAGTQQHADDNGLGVVLNECRAERDAAPKYESSSKGSAGSKAPHGENPGNLEQNEGDAEQSGDITKHTTLEADVLVEPEHDRISKLKQTGLVHLGVLLHSSPNFSRDCVLLH